MYNFTSRKVLYKVVDWNESCGRKFVHEQSINKIFFKEYTLTYRTFYKNILLKITINIVIPVGSNRTADPRVRATCSRRSRRNPVSERKKIKSGDFLFFVKNPPRNWANTRRRTSIIILPARAMLTVS